MPVQVEVAVASAAKPVERPAGGLVEAEHVRREGEERDAVGCAKGPHSLLRVVRVEARLLLQELLSLRPVNLHTLGQADHEQPIGATGVGGDVAVELKHEFLGELPHRVEVLDRPGGVSEGPFPEAGLADAALVLAERGHARIL